MPYLGMAILSLGVVFLIFGGMLDDATREQRLPGAYAPVVPAIAIPLGIGMIILGAMMRKHSRRVESTTAQQPTVSTADSAESRACICLRCKTTSPGGSVFCRNCGQRL